MSQQLARVSADLTELDRLLADRPSVPQPAPQPVPTPQPYAPPPAAYWPPPHQVQPVPFRPATAPATGAAGAAATARRELDRQGPRRRRRRGHAHRRRTSAGARRTGRHPAAGNPRRRRRVAGRCTRWRRGSALCPPRRAGRRDRLGRDRCRRGVHRRHRGHDYLPLGVRPRRPGDRGGDRWRRPDFGSALGLAAPRPAGAIAADRARADRHRRHHAAPDRIHARHLGRIAARPARQGLDLAAHRQDHRLDLSAVGGARRRPLRRRQRGLAGRCVRHRGRAGHRQRADSAARRRATGWRWRC